VLLLLFSISQNPAAKDQALGALPPMAALSLVNVWDNLSLEKFWVP
jgi:hypothetical protein